MGHPTPYEQSKVRARVWSTYRESYIQYDRDRYNSTPRSHYVPALRTWHFAVYTPTGEIVLYDNTGNYQKILDAALIRVEALRHMEIAGHKLKKYKGMVG